MSIHPKGAAILAAEHLLLFERRDEYSPLARYTLGVAALGIGHTLACAPATVAGAAQPAGRVGERR